MTQRLLLYTLLFFYVILFQIYPVVHVHWHDGIGLEACFSFAIASQEPVYDTDAACKHPHVIADYNHFRPLDEIQKLKFVADLYLNILVVIQNHATNICIVCVQSDHPSQQIPSSLLNKSPPFMA